ncbi:hypothetical protein ElyMa_003922300 [Elysia marginata]|uniref:Uncharacterized protein n=1 Tax=Elysia marginata TaxID=1093978 RepID=A0AAV4FR97_9GAST|nr:hypothetical protein ElyMa_003922300 [Elysia marginata]
MALGSCQISSLLSLFTQQKNRQQRRPLVRKVSTSLWGRGGEDERRIQGQEVQSWPAEAPTLKKKIMEGSSCNQRRGCFLPDKVSVRTSLEEKLQEDRKTVRFSDEMGHHQPTTSNKETAGKDCPCHAQSEDVEKIVTPVGYRQPSDCFTVGLKGYGQPYQHPAWTTSQSTHGRHPPPPGLNPVRRPKDSSFTRGQRLGGMASDGNFTTSIESGYIYKPMHG